MTSWQTGVLVLANKMQTCLDCKGAGPKLRPSQYIIKLARLGTYIQHKPYTNLYTRCKTVARSLYWEVNSCDKCCNCQGTHRMREMCGVAMESHVCPTILKILCKFVQTVHACTDVMYDHDYFLAPAFRSIQVFQDSQFWRWEPEFPGCVALLCGNSRLRAKFEILQRRNMNFGRQMRNLKTNPVHDDAQKTIAWQQEHDQSPKRLTSRNPPAGAVFQRNWPTNNNPNANLQMQNHATSASRVLSLLLCWLCWCLRFPTWEEKKRAHRVGKDTGETFWHPTIWLWKHRFAHNSIHMNSHCSTQEVIHIWAFVTHMITDLKKGFERQNILLSPA